MAAIVPIFIFYIMVAKPDYTIMNGLAHVVLPIARGVGDVITWPIRVIGQGADWVKETSNLRAENRRLREKLDVALANKNNCDVAILENQKLEKEIEELTAQKNEIELKLAMPEHYAAEIASGELYKQYEQVRSAIEEKEWEWMETMEN